MKPCKKLALATHTNGTDMYKLNTISRVFYVWRDGDWVKTDMRFKKKTKLTPLCPFNIEDYTDGASKASMGVSLWDCR